MDEFPAPTPWTFTEGDTTPTGGRRILDANGSLIAVALSDTLAQRIVRAVNESSPED